MRRTGKPALDLRAVVRHYKANFRPRSAAELDSFRAEDSLAAAVHRAALAVDAHGKRYSHQRRLKQVHLDAAAERLKQRLDTLASTTNFAGLFEEVQRAIGHLAGLGELFRYDTSLRIAAKKGTLPERVYLHAGAREGARRLGLATNSIALFKFECPSDLRELEAHEIEDVLCIYKRYFDGEVQDIEDARACWTDDDDDDS